MAQIIDLKDLLVWQKSHQLVLRVYKYTIDLPGEEKFGLLSQMRRCGVSIPSNIAEGFRRKGKDKFQFYSYAQGSLEELKYQILLCYDLNYINQDKYSELINLSNEVGKMLNSWIKSLK
jgi:four helix bundle protein